MPTRVAINGFGRIGRTTFKAGFGLKNLDWLAVNDLTDPKTLAHLLQYDSVYRTFDKKVQYNEEKKKIGGCQCQGRLIVGNKKIMIFSEKDPSKLPWKELKIDVAIESTGVFTEKKQAGQHLKAGAKRVIISAPAKGDQPVQTYMRGVNLDKYQDEAIIDNASCTTNCASPVAAVIHQKFGVQKALMSTVHSVTADQRLVDAPHKDLRRARAAYVNIVPTTTGAAIATTKAIPDLEGKFDGMSIRVPVIDVSLVDFTFLLKKKTTVEEVNRYFKKMSQHPLYKGILGVSEEDLVSSDY
ncbi:MAG TPA: glyceraldehyde 3-phosphate dehydrogenase NAD-binding domain-containing protein, partial [Patescibacteria group bacterium]